MPTDFTFTESFTCTKARAPTKLDPLPPLSSSNIHASVHSAQHVTFLLIIPHDPFEAAISFFILQIKKTKAEASQKTWPESKNYWKSSIQNSVF